MEVSYYLSREDIVAFADYQMNCDDYGRPRPKTRPWAWVALVAIVGSMALVGTGSGGCTFDASRSAGEIVGYLAGFLFWGSVLVVFLLRRRLTRQSVLQSLEKPEAALKLGRYWLSMSPECFKVVSPIGSATLNWQAISYVAETEDHAFLVLGQGEGFVVPRLAFSDEDAFTMFVSLARRYSRKAAMADPEPEDPV